MSPEEHGVARVHDRRPLPVVWRARTVGAHHRAESVALLLPRGLPASAALTELVRESVAVAGTPISTSTPLLAALAIAALLR